MGCVCSRGNKVIITTDIKRENMTSKLSHKNYFYSISNKSWFVILDFLKYKDLIEVGKINRHLNDFSKSQSLIGKFFVNKKIDSKLKKSTFINSINKESETNNFSNGWKKLPEDNSSSNILVNNSLHKLFESPKSHNRISFGSFKELHIKFGTIIPKQFLLDKKNSTTLISKLSLLNKSELEEVSLLKPIMYTDDYTNSINIITVKTLGENFSDNKTPSFKDGIDNETNKDLISNIGDLIAVTNHLSSMENKIGVQNQNHSSRVIFENLNDEYFTPKLNNDTTYRQYFG